MAQPDSTPTLGASYTVSPGSGFGTRLDPISGKSVLKPWRKARAVVLPMACGKSTLVQQFGGYDIDDLVVNEAPMPSDLEHEQLINLRYSGVFLQNPADAHAHNQLMHGRASRALATLQPDSNPLVVYCHTAEFAASLGIPIIACAAVTPHCYRATQRYRDDDDALRAVTERVLTQQTAANDMYLRRHPEVSVPHRVCSTYGEVAEVVRASLVAHSLWVEDDNTYLYNQLQYGSREAWIDRSYRIVRARAPSHLVPVAARFLVELSGDAAPQEAHQAFNHPAWCRVLHTAISRAVVPRAWPALTEDGIKAVHPYGPGHSSFALFKITDWLHRTPDWRTAPAYSWFRSAFGRGEVSYEKLAALLAFGDLAHYVFVGGDYSRAMALPLGALESDAFHAVGQAVHNICRISCSFLGQRIAPSSLSFFLYWHCLAGRANTGVDMEAEIADRTGPGSPKRYYIDNRWSETEFDRRLDTHVGAMYDKLGTVNASRIQRALETAGDFTTFMERRRDWVRAGSATGAPKTDLYLRVPAERMDDLAAITEEVGELGLRVVRGLRLNKAATFEFREVVALTKEALANFRPNSFTRYFTKHEAGKPEGRALYPANLLHYIMVSHVLYMAERGGEMDDTRLMSSPDQQQRDHWWWRETREFCIGLMLDYANFNEQHSITHMKSAILNLRRMYGKFAATTPDLDYSIKWVCDSFDEIMFDGNDSLVHFTHGLLSGWRCTTWINSVLNVAYLSVIADQVQDLSGIRVLTEKQTGGDDVAADVATVYHAHLVIRVGESMGFVFKAIKQLLSSKYHEFFRLLVCADGVYGSVCRMLGSATSGQWSNSVLAKFVEPASKLSSVVEIARKAGRRSMLNMTFMEKVQACAFDKWATDGEGRLADELIHGTRATGGLGIPRVDGTMYELDGEPVAEPPRAEMVGLPIDAALNKAERLVSEARAYVGGHVVNPVELATSMSESAFSGALAAAKGAKAAQKLAGSRRRAVVVKRTLSVPADPYARSTDFASYVMSYKAPLAAYKAAGARYGALSQAVKPKARARLAQQISAEYSQVDWRKLLHWQDSLSLYGCATYMLTEDYYDLVLTLAVILSTEPTDHSVSVMAGWLASGLSNDGFLSY